MRQNVFVGILAGGVLLLAAVALVVARPDGDKDEAPILTVPHVTGSSILRAYDLARAAGFQVAVNNGFSVAALCEPIAERQVPRTGAPMRQDGVVTINAGICPLASPAVRRPMPTARVPDFVDKLASEVVDWAEKRGCSGRSVARLRSGPARRRTCSTTTA